MISVTRSGGYRDGGGRTSATGVARPLFSIRRSLSSQTETFVSSFKFKSKTGQTFVSSFESKTTARAVSRPSLCRSLSGRKLTTAEQNPVPGTLVGHWRVLYRDCDCQ